MAELVKHQFPHLMPRVRNQVASWMLVVLFVFVLLLWAYRLHNIISDDHEAELGMYFTKMQFRMAYSIITDFPRL